LLSQFRKYFQLALEYILIFLMLVLTLIVVIAVIYRKAHASLSWYDEVASVMLAWLTYYGSALAAINREHIGFNGIINAMKPTIRVPVIIFGEVLIIGFFVLLAWVGIDVLKILEGDALTSLTWVPTRLTQSVIPIGAVLFIIAEFLSIPDLLRKAKSAGGIDAHDGVEIPNEASDVFGAIKE
jgi:TRAP-type C4-dicarboxylate transport system permease small subunit